MNIADAVAADYIVSLWGAKRRAFARRYWLYLTRKMERPLITECFGATRIEGKLEFIKYAFHGKEEL